MRFRYTSCVVNRSAVFPKGILYRPEIPVQVAGKHGTRFVSAIVDTGADMTIFPRSIAAELGVEFSTETNVSGIMGPVKKMALGQVDLQIVGRALVYRWQTTAGFLFFESPDDEVAVLGHAGFLNYFTVKFDPVAKALELKLARALPSN